MMKTRLVLAACALAAAVGGGSLAARAFVVPERLSDSAFQRLSDDSSEPGGYFRAQNITNLTSNEMGFEYVIPELVRGTRPGGAYLGVGPEQNFTYIAATRPAIAVIFDIRRGNLDLQLMYKALFELAADRADFIAMLFAKPRPAGLGPSSTVDQLFEAFSRVPTSEPYYRRTIAAIEHQLTEVHHLTISADDRTGLESVYETFYWSGFAVRPSPSYADLMTATDGAGVSRSFLATEAGFGIVKSLEERNLIVPVVGDFGGPKAIRAVATALKAMGATVSTFYLSNVEQYLVQDGKWDAFCRNVATLPLDEASTFVRSTSGGGGYGFRGPGFVSSLGAMVADVRQGCGGVPPAVAPPRSGR